MINDLAKLNQQKMVILSVCSIYDKKLKEEYVPSQYEVPFQAGAYFVGDRVCEYNDFDGTEDHISHLNHRYSELTVWYYAWKHLTCDYIGICHYRRKFDIGEEALEEFMEQGYDALVGDLCFSEETIKEDYLTYHSKIDWNTMLTILQELRPEYYEKAVSYFEGHFWYTSCMYVFSKKEFDKASEFLFPILEEFCKRRSEKKEIYQRRDAGFLAERLLSFYFWCNKDRLKYKEVGKKLLETVEPTEDSFPNTDSEEQLLDYVSNLYAKCNMNLFSEKIHSFEQIQSDIIDGSKMIISIYKTELKEWKETLLEYLPFSGEFIKTYHFLLKLYDSIRELMENQTLDSIKRIIQYIRLYQASPIAMYKMMLFGGLLTEEYYCVMLSFLYSNHYLEHFQYFSEKVRKQYPDSIKIDLLLKKCSE